MTEPLDEDFLEAWSKERQLAAWNRQHAGGDRCPTCGHGEHGVICNFGSIFSTCECPSSHWGEKAS